MNAIINWLALNNTLMIKIGFSAIILLVVVYVFRFFFVPKVKEVSVASDLSENDDLLLEKENITKDGAVALSSEEVTKLQAEISTLKYKLKEAEVEKANLASQAVAASNSAVGSSAGLDMVSETNQQTPANQNAVAQNVAAQAELVEKIKVLEARLSEYEIIAEEIAEISKLRQENQELKTKIANGGAFSDSSQTENIEQTNDDVESLASDTSEMLETTTEASPEAAEQANNTQDESSVLDDYLASKNAATATDLSDDDSSRIVITSDVEITDDEKNALNEFEQFRKTKKGSE